MSEQLTRDEIIASMPEDAKELNRVLTELGDYHSLLLSAQFSGRASKVASNLIEYIKDMYIQVQKQYFDHEWVIEHREALENKDQ